MFLAFSMFACQPKEKASAEDSSNEVQTSNGSEQVLKEESKTRNIVFFGNSLTAGYGLDPREAFPALIQDKLDSLGLKYSVINAGLSGETTSGGDARVDWVLNQKPDIFVLELGANDGLRGIPLEETRANLQSIIDKVRKKNAEVEIVLAGMQIPPNMGPEYTSEFRTIFPDLAESNDIALIPFLLDGVAGNPDLNQRDGIHPTVEGQIIVASNVWSVLQPLLQ
ncbi:MAG: arylesterase [Lutimonas sp.]